MKRIITCKICGESKEHYAKDMCKQCYNKRPRKIITCKVCGERREHKLHGMCKLCYRKRPKKIITCKICGERKEHKAHGMCRQCYNKRPREIITCIICGERKEHHIKGMCKLCYSKERREYRRIHKKPRIIICKVCGEKKEHHVKGMCKLCYNKERRRPINSECPTYLGCDIAERVLSKVFKDVETMPFGNPGYDFICNKGKKIDVKSSCKRKGRNSWLFHTKRNTTADFFLCIAFDDRESLTPLHLWLLPSDEVKDKRTTSIRESTFYKWDKFKLDISKTLQCCDEIRG